MSGFLILLGLAIIAVAVVVLIRGRSRRPRLPNRRSAAGLLGAGFVLFVIGIVLTPSSATVAPTRATNSTSTGSSAETLAQAAVSTTTGTTSGSAATKTPAPTTLVPATPKPPTATRIPPTATTVPPTSTPVPPTATPVLPTATPAPDKAQAKAIDPRELEADPKSFIGQNVVLTGLVNNVTQNDAPATVFGAKYPSHTWTDFRADVPGHPAVSIALVASWFPKNSHILKDDNFRLWAIVRGTEEVTIVLTGATKEVPAIEVYASAPIQPS